MSDPTEADKAAREAAEELIPEGSIRSDMREYVVMARQEVILRHMQPVIDAARAEGRDEVLSDSVRGDVPCSGCGTQENIVWFTDNTLWNMVIREPGGSYEGNEPILCISCFVMAVHQRDLFPTGWRLLPEWPIRSLHSPIYGAGPATERVPRDVVPSPGEIGALQSARAEGEVCICAAILLADGRLVRGHRHASCFREAEGWTPKPDMRGHVQGFITSRNRFVGRREGATLQRAAHIKSAMTERTVDGDLFSEDLYFEKPEAEGCRSTQDDKAAAKDLWGFLWARIHNLYERRGRPIVKASQAPEDLPARHHLAEALNAARADGRRERDEAQAINEIAWGVIANVSRGDWTRETQEWQDAAARWRDMWLGQQPCPLTDANLARTNAEAALERVRALADSLRSTAQAGIGQKIEEAIRG